jgi:hypothetical protein
MNIVALGKCSLVFLKDWSLGLGCLMYVLVTSAVLLNSLRYFCLLILKVFYTISSATDCILCNLALIPFTVGVLLNL